MKHNSLLIFTLLILLSCSIYAKTNEATVQTSCPIESLMLDTSSLPEGWKAGTPSRAPERWGSKRLAAHSSSGFEHNVMYQHVHQGENFKHTSDGYFELMTSWFHTDEDYTEWYLPLEFPYKNTVADRYRFGCTTVKHNGNESCRFVGQYGIYITELEVWMLTSVTYDDLEHILRTIDTKMTQCFN